MRPSHIWNDDGHITGVPPVLLWLIWLMWLPFLIQPTSDLLHLPPSPRKAASAVGLALFLGAYLWTTWQGASRLTRPLRTGVREQGRAWWLPIGALAALSVVLPFVQGSWGLGGFIYTSASVASRLTARQCVLVFSGLMLFVVLVGALTLAPWPMIALMVFLTPAVGATVASFTGAIRTNRDLRLARREIARLAVSEERLRIARDLHDLLGHTLSLIALKSELAGQLIPENPARAQREVQDIETAARTALQEVREAVAGYRQTSLADELENAHQLLAAAGIQCRVHNDAGTVPPAVEALLTWVVREGVTNVIRHSRATTCVISLTREPEHVCLGVVDDGHGGHTATDTATDTAGRMGRMGNGLPGIRERVAALGGTCAAGPAGARGFQLTVRLPLQSLRARPVAGQLQQSRGMGA